MSGQAAMVHLTEEDAMRANLYAFLGRVLFKSPTQEILADMKALSGDETELGDAFNVLSKLAESDVKSATDEYNGLFIGMGRGELLPYASYYLTGFLNEKPLAKLRNSMRELGIARQDKVVEPEDHIGSLMEMMSGLISGNYGSPASLEVQKEFFETHIEPWAGHFFKDLEAAELSRIYHPIGTIGRLFLEIEKDAFAMS